MKLRMFVALCAILALAACAETPAVVPTPVPYGTGLLEETPTPASMVMQAIEGENLLTNGSFEGTYVVHAPRLAVAPGWGYWWSDRAPPFDGGSPGPCTMPEYKELKRSDYSYRVRDGEKSQSWFAFYSMMDAGLYQVVQVQQGDVLQASGWWQGWASKDDDDYKSSRGEFYVSIGIDPYGRSSYRDQGILWSPWVWAGSDWVQVVSPVAVAKANQVTVYFRAATKWALKHGDAILDQAALYRVDLGGGPTPTPYPTYTPYPTSTPAPTYTPYPTPAITPCPTCPAGGDCLTLEQLQAEIERWEFVIRPLPESAEGNQFFRVGK
jgi:hypothetical protein